MTIRTHHAVVRAPEQVALLGTILGVWAHPDDEAYLCGGMYALARAAGARVVCVTATRGELGGEADLWPPGSLAAQRTRELASSLALLGVDEHHWLDLPDGGLDDLDAVGPHRIAALVDEVQPDTIITFGPDGATFHPDHLAVHRWTTVAWDRSGRRARLLYAAATQPHVERFGALYERWGVYMTEQRPEAVPVDALAVHLPLAGPALDRKLAALRAMATQTAGAIRLMGESLFAEQAAEESFVDAVVRSPALVRS